ncbi:hypothetical protein AX17_004777 [Amanita inopinata Kibby_2008]|nr:hypothetical protein AX17_004777 [Amanita inopinata Kibby_2008]
MSSGLPAPKPDQDSAAADSQPDSPGGGEGYPEQKHAGAVGYGPNYHRGADISDKFGGLYEQAKGKIMHKPELVQHGHERYAGELKRKEKKEDL